MVAKNRSTCDTTPEVARCQGLLGGLTLQVAASCWLGGEAEHDGGCSAALVLLQRRLRGGGGSLVGRDHVLVVVHARFHFVFQVCFVFVILWILQFDFTHFFLRGGLSGVVSLVFPICWVGFHVSVMGALFVVSNNGALVVIDVSGWYTGSRRKPEGLLGDPLKMNMCKKC